MQDKWNAANSLGYSTHADGVDGAFNGDIKTWGYNLEEAEKGPVQHHGSALHVWHKQGDKPAPTPKELEDGHDFGYMDGGVGPIAGLIKEFMGADGGLEWYAYVSNAEQEPYLTSSIMNGALVGAVVGFLTVAQALGCKWASSVLVNNDGDLWVEAWGNGRISALRTTAYFGA